jgi:hypothetical protein
MKTVRIALVLFGLSFLYLSSGSAVFHALAVERALGLLRLEVRTTVRIAENYRLRGDVQNSLQYLRLAMDAAGRIRNEAIRTRIRGRLKKMELRLLKQTRTGATSDGGQTAPLAPRALPETLRISWRNFRLGFTFLDDAALNFAVFFLFGFLFYASWERDFGRNPFPKILIVLSVSLLFSGSVEMAQLHTPPRTADFGDLFYDSSGAFLGALAAGLALPVFTRLARRGRNRSGTSL